MPRNFYIMVSIQTETEVEAWNKAAKVAAAINETAWLHESGTKRRIVGVTAGGDVMAPASKETES